MFGRSKPESQSSASASNESTAPTKGRPTPSRKEAEAARKALLKGKATPRSGSSKDDRETRLRQRERMLAGDESSLMPRDQGPSRRYARNFVDSRRNAGELFLPGALLILVLGFIRNVTVQSVSLWIWFAMVLVIAIDTTIMVGKLKKTLLQSTPGADASGLAFYATMRALQIRRLRGPKPQRKVGDTP